ncbi:MAG: hypothetical protein A3H32_16200 [Betaproteobacteria bacterium RIFCSPLOWO2_02_FULL_63_19]|nr:MAG: hypothetical protein A3H32_16200 [Betaproteobacteria bacterium RIFCSPLOWO2_02_FULL_63_19]
MTRARWTDDKDPGELSVLGLLERLDRVSPDGEMVYSIPQGRGITHRQMFALSNRIACFFRDRGFRANDRVVLLGANSLEYLVIYCGVWRYGLTLVIINTEMNAVHLEGILGTVAPRMVLHDSSFDPAPFRHATGDAQWLRFGEWHADASPVDTGAKSEELFALIAGYPSTADVEPVAGPEDFACIAFTSGTSSKPKGVINTYRGIMANAISTSMASDVGAEDRLLEFRALSWASARSRFLSALTTGCAMVIAERFSQSRFFDWIRDQRVTIAYCVPTAINMLLERPAQVSRTDLPTLRFVTSSTAPLPLERQRQFEATFGIPIIQFYGMSEAGNVACNPPEAPRFGSAGRICHLQDLRILDADGNQLGHGQVGEITTASPMMAWGYLKDDGTLESLDGKRMSTGDLGYLDAEGYLHLTGRVKDLIIRGGVSIQPLEIDNVLLKHPAVSQASTIGVPDKIYGEEVVAYVVAKNGASVSAEAIKAHCSAQLPEAKVPKQVIFVADIAKNERGKVDRNAMKALWTSAQGENRPS